VFRAVGKAHWHESFIFTHTGIPGKSAWNNWTSWKMRRGSRRLPSATWAISRSEPLRTQGICPRRYVGFDRQGSHAMHRWCAGHGNDRGWLADHILIRRCISRLRATITCSCKAQGAGADEPTLRRITCRAKAQAQVRRATLRRITVENRCASWRSCRSATCINADSRQRPHRRPGAPLTKLAHR